MGKRKEAKKLAALEAGAAAQTDTTARVDSPAGDPPTVIISPLDVVFAVMIDNHRRVWDHVVETLGADSAAETVIAAYLEQLRISTTPDTPPVEQGYTSKVTVGKGPSVDDIYWRMQNRGNGKIIDASSEGFGQLREADENIAKVRAGWANPEIVHVARLSRLSRPPRG